jgi:hypothetical protein
MCIGIAMIVYSRYKNNNNMSKLTFTDGESFDLSGPLRLEERYDGWYVLGNNKMIPVSSQDEGNKLISQLNN